MSQTARNVLFLVGLACIVGALAWGLSRRSSGPTDALGMAPNRTAALAEIDVPGVRRSTLFRDLVGDADQGLREIERTCGFDPLDQLRSAYVYLLRQEGAAPDSAGASLDEVAFVARGELDHEALARCIGDVVSGDGGGVHATVIEGRDALASDHGSSVAAFYGPDGVVAGADTIVAELLRIQDGASPAMPRDEDLQRLFRLASSRSHVRLVARLPRNWQRFLGTIADMAEDLERLGRASALGLGATLDDGLGVTLALDLDAPADAQAAQHGLEERIAEALRDPEVATSVLAVALRHVTLHAEGTDLVARADLDRPELDATIALIRQRVEAEGDEGLP